MSSSKIMGYNLDDSVLDGVAMQSTSEEILEKVSGSTNEHRLPIIAGGAYSKNTTVLSITGKGRLYYAIANLQNTKDSAKNAQLKVVVDGEIVYHIKATSTTTWQVDLHGGIVPIAVLEMTGHSSNADPCIAMNTTDSFTAHWIGHYNYHKEIISQPSAIVREYTGSNYGTKHTDHMFINEYLVFNESLEVSVTYGNTEIACNVCYSLDE